MNSSARVATTQTGLGTVLTGTSGMTLYVFEKDTNGRSHCSGSCAALWPPLTTSAVPKAAADGVTAGKLGMVKRSDGTEQVTYAGHPLYYYAPDQRPGNTFGEGLDDFGAKWYVVNPAGSMVVAQ